MEKIHALSGDGLVNRAHTVTTESLAGSPNLTLQLVRIFRKVKIAEVRLRVVASDVFDVQCLKFRLEPFFAPGFGFVDRPG